MTNQKTPEQGGATEEQVEAAARALACIEPGDDWPTNGELGGSLTGTRDDEYRDGMRDQARAALEAAAAVSASASAHPADERHDAEEREAESEDHAATVASKARVLSVLNEHTIEFHHPYCGIGLFSTDAEEIATAIAAPVEVDEAKLAEAIAEELETDDRIAAEWSAGKLAATARRLVEFAVKPVLRGDGR